MIKQETQHIDEVRILIYSRKGLVDCFSTTAKEDFMKSAYAIRPLAEPKLVLFIGGGQKSQEVAEVLAASGIEVWREEGPVEPWQRAPLLLYHGAAFQGAESIHELLKLLEFWSSQNISRSCFREAA